MTAAMKNPLAAARLRKYVDRYRLEDGRAPSILALSQVTGLSRQALTNWLEQGGQPDMDGMRRIADALGVSHKILWLKWLDIPLPNDSLVRIADALERAYPPVDDAERADAQDAADRATPALEGLRSPSARPAPRG